MIENRVHITQGQHAIGGDHRTIISTLLGSCVSVCLWDEEAGVGGMNHMLLVENGAGSKFDSLAHINEIELLINAMSKQGARRERLKAKAFGGARMVSGLSDIGQRNAKYTLNFLANEGIPLVTHSLGGTSARNIRFWPSTGKALQRLADASLAPDQSDVVRPCAGNGLELF
ncbi:MAG: chemotaxis protein CheD [Pseudomonadota bacterium]